MDPLSPPPSQVQSSDDAQQALRRLIEAEGVLHGSDTELRGRSGKPLTWLLYTPQVTLTSEGNRLASRCLLECLEPFGPVQLAAYGITGLPLLVGITILSDGRYNGLIIRERAKRHGAMRQIDGPIRRDLPVVIVDDSLVSGEAFRAGAQAIEAAGLQVAGIACLVDFRGSGGREWAESLGYRVEAVFELGRDLRLAPDPPLPSFALPPQIPLAVDPSRRCETLPDLVRFVATRLLNGDSPDSVPMLVHARDAPGGAFVSIRDIATDARLVREGFFALDQEAPNTAATVAFATERCIRRAKHRLSSERLSSLKIAVSCISGLDSIQLGDLDADRYGLFVRGRTHPWQMGAALPNTPERESEAQQYRECLRKAGLRTEAPHDLYRFSVTKEVQANQTWQPYGVPAESETIPPDFVDYLRGRTEEIIDGGGVEKMSNPAPSQPWETHGVGVTVYRDGRLLGIHVSLGNSLQTSLERAALKAWAAAGLGSEPPVRREQCQIVVSVLHHRYRLGNKTADSAAGWFRPSVHAVVAETDGGSSTVLPHIACHHGWDASKVAQLALGKADPTDAAGSAEWASYQTSSWLMTDRVVYELRAGFAARPEESLEVTELATQIADYILAEAVANDGFPAYERHPVLDATTKRGTAGRVLMALTALAEAGPLLGRAEYTAAAGRGARRVLDGLRREDGRDLDLVLPDLRAGDTAECHALLLLVETAAPAGSAGLSTLAEPVANDLFSKVSALFRADGMITRLPAGFRLETDHEVLPGLALAAVVAYTRAQQDAVLPDSLDRQLDWYRRRFEKAPRWLAAGWLMQGWASAWRATGDPRYAEFVLSVADWTCARQFHINGAFLTDPHRRTGCFNTGYLAEGIAAALAVSRELGDRERERKLRGSLRRALRFVAALMIRREDLYCMPAGESVVGAVRDSPVNPSLRIDQSAHALRAMLGAISNDIHEV